MTATNSFAGTQGTLATFCTERPVFLRERFSKSYRTFTYFLARTGINLPFELIYPTAGLLVIYWGTNFGAQTIEEMFKLILVVNAIYFCATSYGLVYAAVIPKLETAMQLTPVLIIPFMLLGGFFINLDQYHDIRIIFYPIMYLSPFKYGFQGGMAAVNISPAWEPRSPVGLSDNIWIMLALGIILRLVAAIFMQVISNPKRSKMIKINNSQQLSS